MTKLQKMGMTCDVIFVSPPKFHYLRADFLVGVKARVTDFY